MSAPDRVAFAGPAADISAANAAPALRVSSPLDHSEREADSTADRIMAMASPLSTAASPAAETPPDAGIQRSASGCGCHDQIHRQPYPGGDNLVHRSAPGPGGAHGGVSSRDIRSLGSGAPLPQTSRSFFEPRFGTDLGNVRLHTGKKAGGLAQRIGARAFTHRQQIAFAPGEYRPGTSAGRRLLAHELTHTVQNRRRPGDLGLQRSRALFISTQGTRRYLRYAAAFHRQEGGHPTPINVGSVEEMLEHMATMSSPIEWVRIVTHAIPDGIFMPLLRGGGTTLFQQDMSLQRDFDLERELSTEHRTVRRGREREVQEINHHLADASWVDAVWRRAQTTYENAMLLVDIGVVNSPPQFSDMHSYFWWIIDRELANSSRQTTDRRGRTVNRFIISNARHRAGINRNVGRNIAIFRSKVLAGPWVRGIPLDEARIARPERSGPRTEAQVTALEAMIVTAARAHIAIETSGAFSLPYTRPDRGSEDVQGALERGTYADNLLRVKYLIANGAELQIRGCNIGQNMPWLRTFRDFFGHGQDSHRSRPHVSAPDITQVYERRRRGRRGPVTYREYLDPPRGRNIHPGTAEYENHIKHVR